MSDQPTFDVPFKSDVLPQRLDEDSQIRFRCHKGISCFNACCRNADVTLTPYDILRLKDRLGLSVTEFLQQHTVLFEMDADRLPGVKLRTDDEGACRLMMEDGCSVYQDRPTACRYYPVGHLAMRPKDSASAEHHYVLIQEEHCKGHLEDRHLSIGQYREEQGLLPYDEMNRGWYELLLKKKSAGPTVGKPPELSLQLFFMACYDQDRFRRFVQSDAFKKMYILGQGDYAKLAQDEIALMEFGYRFLRQVLFGEQSIPGREGAWEERYEQRKEVFELRRQAEIARAQQQEDDKYQNDV